jgi:type IV pilus assembly protein PilA
MTAAPELPAVRPHPFKFVDRKMSMLTNFRALCARCRAAMRDSGQKGFTLIELMVVVIIIGILAFIAIPQFLGQRESAWDAETKSDLGNFLIAAASYNVDNKGLYGTSSTAMSKAALTASPYDFSPSTDVPIGNWTLTVASDKKSFTVSVYNKNFPTSANHLFVFDSTTGQTTVS